MTRDRVDLNFESVAEHYSGRMPYLPAFFAKAVELFGLTKSSTVLDLGCGTGALSFGFAPYCKSVLAVDRSPNMLANRPETPANVRFLRADLNAENAPLPVRADLVVIGMAVHFFDKEKLIPLLEAATAPSAPAFVCGTTISPETPWFAEYSELRRRYGSGMGSLDIYGQARFSGTSWSRGRLLRVGAKRPFTTRHLFEHALSFPSSLDRILKEKDDFERHLEKLLSPHYGPSNQAIAEILSWGLEYRRA